MFKKKKRQGQHIVPLASNITGKLARMQVIGPYSRLKESEGVGDRNLTSAPGASNVYTSLRDSCHHWQQKGDRARGQLTALQV